MAKDKNNSTGVKDLGTVKEVYCSGVSITSTGAKIFIANVSKGDRIVEEDGKKKIAPKLEAKPADTKPAKPAKPAKNEVVTSGLNTQAGSDGFLDEGENTQSNNNESPGSNDGENLPKVGE